MKFTIKITYTTISGVETSRKVVINASTPVKAMRISMGIAVILETGPGRSMASLVDENAPIAGDEVSIEDAILWALTGGGK